jgi:hypothetical protein
MFLGGAMRTSCADMNSSGSSTSMKGRTRRITFTFSLFRYFSVRGVSGYFRPCIPIFKYPLSLPSVMDGKGDTQTARTD